MWDIKLILIGFACNLLVFPFDVSCTNSVPVYLWETSQFSEIVPALTRLEQEEFRKIIADRTSTDNPVLVFAEETLSPEDFSLRDVDEKLIFDKISSLKSSAHTTYWPLVKNPITAVNKLNKSVVHTSIKNVVDNPSFSLNPNDLLIIDLKDAMDGEDRLEMLKRHDQDIAKVYERYAKIYKNIITILTSYRSSWVLSEELRSTRRSRDVQNVPPAKPEDEPKPQDSSQRYESEDMLIFVNSAASLNYRGQRTLLDGFDLDTKSQKDENSINTTMRSETYKDISLTFNIKFGSGYWSLSNITVLNGSEQYSLWIRDVYAPQGFSYHCHTQTFYNMSNSNVNLILPGFQMQVYFNNTEGKGKKFGDAYDCIGFMSAPIWSGLFVTFIMALIMIFGLTMIMDIKTMDRFDDPKGKTITISASE